MSDSILKLGFEKQKIYEDYALIDKSSGEQIAILRFHLPLQKFQCLWPYKNDVLNIHAEAKTPFYKNEIEAVTDMLAQMEQDKMFLAYCQKNREKVRKI